MRIGIFQAKKAIAHILGRVRSLLANNFGATLRGSNVGILPTN
ncbi:MAG: hypothetical protein WBV73_19680 [Phormidium sp.]